MNALSLPFFRPRFTVGGGGGGVKWTDEEVDMLHNAVRTFAEDLQTISETIKQRTVLQIKTALKKKVRQQYRYLDIQY